MDRVLGLPDPPDVIALSELTAGRLRQLRDTACAHMATSLSARNPASPAGSSESSSQRNCR